jgi:hypothetical protein
LICASGEAGLEPPLGSSTQTTPNQNTKRNRKNITHQLSPAAFSSPLNQTVADSLEPVVGDEARVLGKIDTNAMRFFIKFDMIEFDSIFNHRRRAL